MVDNKFAEKKYYDSTFLLFGGFGRNFTTHLNIFSVLLFLIVCLLPYRRV